MCYDYDLAVIGAGPGGYVAALRAAQRGLRVALIEARESGGTCLNRGCIPTKALLHSASLYQDLLTAGDAGVTAEGIGYDWAGIQAFKNRIVDTQREGLEGLISARSITVMTGRGALTAPHEVTVSPREGEARSLTAASVVLATGTEPAYPPIPGLELPGVVDSDILLAREVEEAEQPVIIGGGVIGVEFAHFYAGLGKKVVVLEALPSLLAALDGELGKFAEQTLKRRKVKVHTGAKVTEVVKEADGLMVHAEVKGKLRSFPADQVLVATGRRPLVQDLTYEPLEMVGGRIKVDEAYRTNLPDVYAIGDVIPGPQLAHKAEADGRILVDRLTQHTPHDDIRYIPSCIYLDPEIASIGLSEEAADAAGIAYGTSKFLMTGNARMQIEGLGRGFIKVVYAEEDQKLLGIHIASGVASDLISEFGNYLSHGFTVPDMLHVVRPHPSFSEGVTDALEGVEGEAIHQL